MRTLTDGTQLTGLRGGDGIPIPTERRHEPLLIIERGGDRSLIRVRTELYHKPISVESPGQGALKQRKGTQKPETSEDELLKLLSRGAEFQLESRPDPKQSELSKSPGQELLRLKQVACFLYRKRKHPYLGLGQGIINQLCLSHQRSYSCIC